MATWLLCDSILLTVLKLDIKEQLKCRKMLTVGYILESLCSSCAFQGSIEQMKHSSIKLMCWLRHFKVLLLSNNRICGENEVSKFHKLVHLPGLVL